MPEPQPASPARSAAGVVLLLCGCALGSHAAFEIPQRKAKAGSFAVDPLDDRSDVRLPKGELSSLVDVNRASVEELEALPGIGPVIARRIVAFREAAGPFAEVTDLIRVRGIGPAKLARLRSELSANVESNPDAGGDGHDESVEQTVGVGGHPIAARVRTDRPTVIDQVVESD